MNLCQETSGFLFPHPCGRPGLFRCMLCSKLVCLQHARPQGLEQFRCVTCARTADAHSDSGTDADWDSNDNDDPYFYSSSYRARSGGEEPDPQNFTEGDQALFDKEGDESFEDDMGGS